MAKKKRAPVGNGKRATVWAKTDGQCHLCGTKLVHLDWDMDHLVPKGHAGSDELWNLLPSCKFCNNMKRLAKQKRMRRLLMYGRHCLEEARKRQKSALGQMIFELVGKRAKGKPVHEMLHKTTIKKPTAGK